MRISLSQASYANHGLDREHAVYVKQ